MNRRSIISTISRPALVLLFFTAAACSMKLGTPPPAAVSHVLRDPGAAAAAAGEGSEHALLIRETDAPALIGNRRMIFSRAPHTRQAYQYATWTEPAAARFTTLLTDRLAAGGMFTAISTTSGHRGTGIPADLQLAVELREFYHDGAVPPGTARLEIDARLLDAAAGRLVAHRRFRTAAPVSTYDAAGAAAALSDAVGTALDELTAWLAGTIDTLPR